MTISENYSLKAHNTFGVDARCKTFAEYDTPEQLREIIFGQSLQGSRPTLHIGGGSNLLFTGDYDGLVLHSAVRGVEIERRDEDVMVMAGAGECWDDFVGRMVEEECFGLENLSDIPGEVGASAVQNIGAYGAEVGQFIDRVEVMDAQTGERKTIPASECRYAYRYSTFKDIWRGRYYVCRVGFRLSRKYVPRLGYVALEKEIARRGLKPEDLTAKKVRSLIKSVRQSKLPWPEGPGSAGSFFMNPVVEKSLSDRLLAQYPDMPRYVTDAGVKLSAGWLIEQCGWKGRSLGAAGVYEKQALVLVNRGGATGADIVRLSDAVRHDVKDKFGVELHPEVNFI